MRLIWGTGQFAVSRRAVHGRQPGFRRWAARYERESLSRSKIVPFGRINDESTSHVLSSIYAPTLVMHARGDHEFRFGAVAIWPTTSSVHVSGIPTDDHVPWFGAQDAYLDAMEEFVDGDKSECRSLRKFATVLFTDIVDSTTTPNAPATPPGACPGPARRLSRIEIGICGGRWVKSTGDGCSQCSTARDAQSDSWALSERIRRSSASKFAPGYTQARSRPVATMWPA